MNYDWLIYSFNFEINFDQVQIQTNNPVHIRILDTPKTAWNIDINFSKFFTEIWTMKKIQQKFA